MTDYENAPNVIRPIDFLVSLHEMLDELGVDEVEARDIVLSAIEYTEEYLKTAPIGQWDVIYSSLSSIIEDKEYSTSREEEIIGAILNLVEAAQDTIPESYQQ